MPHPRGRFAQAKALRGLEVGKLFKVPEHDHLAVIFVEKSDRIRETLAKLNANGFGPWSETGVAELSGEIKRRPIDARRVPQRTLAVDTPTRRDPMLAMLIDDMVASDLPQPEMEGQGGLFEIFRKPLVGFYQYLLNHITGIDPTCESGVESVADHSPKRSAMVGPQLFRGTLIMLLDAVKQDPRLKLVGPHPYLILPQVTFASVDYIEKKSSEFR